MLPGWDDDLGSLCVDLVRGQGIDAGRWPERPVGADGVVTFLEFDQAVPAVPGVVVEAPINLFGL